MLRIVALLAAVAGLLATSAAGAAVPKPRIVQRPIPYGEQRKADMAAYARRHYRLDTFALTAPKVIVQHYTANESFVATYNTFAPNRADPELREKPGVCAHFVIDRDGTIYQVVPLALMCRHTVGLNHTAIGIEHVGTSDHQVLGNSPQMRASLRLTRWLRCREAIAVRNVIGHAESLSSPHHRELVARLARQTHADFPRAAMARYRARLRRAGGCS